jgi:hypothetical protein
MYFALRQNTKQNKINYLLEASAGHGACTCLHPDVIEGQKASEIMSHHLSLSLLPQKKGLSQKRRVVEFFKALLSITLSLDPLSLSG